MTIGTTEFAGGTINFCSNAGIADITTERPEIWVDAPRDQGFGWTVVCGACDFSEKMLSEHGAKMIAKGHRSLHIPKIVVTS